MRKNTFVCEKHKKTARSAFGARCPICQQPMKSIGDKKRIGHCGQFDKIERKTRKFDGQRKETSWRYKSQRAKEYREMMEKFKIKTRPIHSDCPDKFK